MNVTQWEILKLNPALMLCVSAYSNAHVSIELTSGIDENHTKTTLHLDALAALEMARALSQHALASLAIKDTVRAIKANAANVRVIPVHAVGDRP